MNASSIKNQLRINHIEFIDEVCSLPAEEFTASVNGKWTAGQQLEHIYLSVKPLRRALGLPKILLRLLFGKANRPSRTYDELIEKYNLKLKDGGRATGRFTPKSVTITQRTALANTLNKEVNSLRSLIDRFSENELDVYILPHPLLGKLTLREMLYFTIHHVEHHRLLVKQNLQNVQLPI